MKHHYITHFLILCTTLITSSSVTANDLKLVTQEFVPFTYQINQVVSGPAADIIRETCKRMNMDCPLRSYPWRRAQVMVEKGYAHGMFVIGWSKKRAEWLHYSPPLMRSEYGFFVRNENPLQFKTPLDIKGYTISVYGPSNTSDSLEKIKSKIDSITIDLRPHDESCFKKLSGGRVDAVYSNRDVGYAMLQKLGIENVRYAGAHEQLAYYIGFSQKFSDKKIVERFNAKFRDLYKQGVILNILEKYNMEPADME